MRLLEIKSPGVFSLVQVATHNSLDYAILSHTWTHGEEVTYEDIIDGAGKSKTGYKKIKFCGEQAAKDGLQYFWVDTCCIDKSNAVELTTSINSMFRWYRNAKKCYVYLTDVSLAGYDADVQANQSSWEADFRNSRWFTRGWTLQELIAPATVEFFSREGKQLGNKNSLERPIHEITKVPIQALRGNPFSDFSIAERKRWAVNRQTTEEEDMAYCLLGLCEVFMPPIYGEGKDAAMRRLQMTVNQFPQDGNEPTDPEGNDVPFTVPFDRNLKFTGRKAELAKLEERLFVGGRPTKCAITGLGGVGKTQLVLELVYQVRDKYKNCSVIWIPATNIESLHRAYVSTAEQLDIPGWKEDKADVKRLVQDYLSKKSTGQWLLVFDNADEINMWICQSGSNPGSGRLIEYLPRSEQGCILFTTRDRKTAVKLAHQNVVEVPEMNEDVATQLLQKCLVNPDLLNNKLEASALLEKLTCLPLAIVQAAAYINENGITFADYLLLLTDQEENVISLLSEDFEDDGRYHDLENPVATTWLISFEQIRQREPFAADYLSFMSCIDSKDIPLSLLPAGASRKKEIDAIGILDAYSFITRRSVNLALDLHRLVHLATRNWLRKEELITQWTKKAIERLDEVLPNYSHENRITWKTHLPHAHYVLKSSLVESYGDNRANLASKAGRFLYYEGRYNESENLFAELVEYRKMAVGLEHPDTLSSMNNLALLLKSQGKYDEAEPLYRQTLQLREKVLGKEHPNMLRSMNNLALLLQSQGKYDKAEPLYRQTLQLSEKVLGKEHPDTLTSMNNLASLLESQGKYDEAEPMYQQTLQLSEKVLGKEHPDTLKSMNNLALFLQSQGKYDEAEPMYQQTLQLKEKVLGKEHPGTLTSMHNFASLLGNQGKYDEAEPIHRQTLQLREKFLGKEHPDTLNSRANLAKVFYKQRRWKEAEELYVQVMETRKRLLGTEDPKTLIIMTDLASTFYDQGRLKEAEELEVQVMETRKKVLGQEHSDTLNSMHNLAFTYKRNGRRMEAIELMEDCVRLQTQVLGADHPDTLSSRYALLHWQTEKLQISASVDDDMDV